MILVLAAVRNLARCELVVSFGVELRRRRWQRTEVVASLMGAYQDLEHLLALRCDSKNKK
jgi:hypothetical protein